MMTSLEHARQLEDFLLSTRRLIHKHPELSFQEFNTSALIRSELDAIGVMHKTYVNTGVVAHIGSGTRCVALRCDIDALPVKEETGLEYTSQNEGVMHACGHDMHTAMLLGAAKILKNKKFDGVIKLIFQPGEEKLPGGASLMIDEGALLDPMPEVIFGQHIFPEEETGVVSLAPGYVMASTDELYWTITAKGCHAAQPHLSGDPILAASQLVQQAQNILTKFRDPLDSAVVSITSFNSGFTTNIIPAEAKLMGTMRTFNEDLRKLIKTKLSYLTEQVAALYDVEAKLVIVQGYPSLRNDSKAYTSAKQSALKIFNEEKVKEFRPKMWAEDFSYYAQRMPACFWFLGVKPLDTESLPPLHNSKLAPDEKAMHLGSAMLAQAALDWLAS